MYIFYEYPNCSTCRKAKAELKELGVTFQSINIKENPPTVDLLLKLFKQANCSLKTFFNTSGTIYRQLHLKDSFQELSVKQAMQLLSKNGMLIKRPLLIKDHQLLQIGYKTPYKALNLK